jgi:hypothetical protein
MSLWRVQAACLGRRGDGTGRGGAARRPGRGVRTRPRPGAVAQRGGQTEQQQQGSGQDEPGAHGAHLASGPGPGAAWWWPEARRAAAAWRRREPAPPWPVARPPTGRWRRRGRGGRAAGAAARCPAAAPAAWPARRAGPDPAVRPAAADAVGRPRPPPTSPAARRGRTGALLPPRSTRSRPAPTGRPPPASTRTLARVTSRWTTPCRCAASRVSSSPRPSRATRPVGSSPSRSTSSCSDGASTSSITSSGRPFCTSTSCSTTAPGWLNLAASRASPSTRSRSRLQRPARRPLGRCAPLPPSPTRRPDRFRAPSSPGACSPRSATKRRPWRRSIWSGDRRIGG